MFDWLRRLLNLPVIQNPVARLRTGGSAAGSRSKVRVMSDPDKIVVTRADGREEVLRWADLAVVGIVTNDGGPFITDLFWLLQSADRRQALAVPLGAAGENDFLHAMQARLKGFDNMAVVEAMSSTENAGFTVWDSSWPQQDRHS
jgi:hypothetical protein